MDIDAITRRILSQRMHRYPDAGPDLGGSGTARFRAESGRLRVAFADIGAGMACDAVERVLRFGRWQGLFEVQWVVMPQRSGEGELPAALRQAEFRLHEDLLLMAHEGPIRVQSNPAVEVSPITSFQAMWQYEHGSRQNFFDEPEPIDVVVEHRARERWREQEHGWSRYYQAQLRGKVVGGCYISLFEDVPTLLGVYTVHEARRNGVATALLARAVADTIYPGHEACCLFVKLGNPAERLYRQLGFVPLLNEQTYTWQSW
jgi:GNAT superfamily N-acetyltransferase